MILQEKNRIYGKTKEIDTISLKKAFADERFDFVQLALLFGSRVTGKAHSKSDYDFAILTKENIDAPWGVKAKAYNVIEEVLGLCGECDFDVVDLKNANSVILDSIKEAYLILKGDESEFSRLLAKKYKNCK